VTVEDNIPPEHTRTAICIVFRLKKWKLISGYLEFGNGDKLPI
jgi:hypothetical protein